MQQQNKAVALMWSQPTLSGGLGLFTAGLTLPQEGGTRSEARGSRGWKCCCSGHIAHVQERVRMLLNEVW